MRRTPPSPRSPTLGTGSSTSSKNLSKILIGLNLVQIVVLIVILCSNDRIFGRDAALHDNPVLAAATSNDAPTSISNHRQLKSSQQSRREPTGGTPAYVFEREDEEWSPPLKEVYKTRIHKKLVQKRLEKLFVPSYKGSRHEMSLEQPREQEFLMFIRIPKTGSTTMMDLLQNYSPNLFAENVFLKHSYINNDDLEDDAEGALGCVYGARTSGNGLVPANYDPEEYSCPHLLFGGMMKILARSLEHLKPSLLPNLQRVAVHPFTIVRDPFDRLVSFFYYQYQHRHEQVWQQKFTDAQILKLMGNDLPGWLQLIHEDDTANRVAMLNQHTYFSPDHHIAKFLVQEGRILTLVQECFDVSVKLLLDLYPHLFGQEQIHHFLAAGEDSNVNRELKEEHNRLSPQQMNELRRKAMTTWFPEQYRLHWVIVGKFREQVAKAADSPTTVLTQSEVQQCFQTLDSLYPKQASSTSRAM